MLLDINVTQRWVASHRDHDDIVFMDNGCSEYYGTLNSALGLGRVTAHKGGGRHPAPWLDQNRPYLEHGFFLVKWHTRGPTRQIRRVVFLVLHPETWYHFSWTSTPGVPVAPFRLRYLAVERLYDLAMAL
jgi:hypothetical protein